MQKWLWQKKKKKVLKPSWSLRKISWINRGFMKIWIIAFPVKILCFKEVWQFNFQNACGVALWRRVTQPFTLSLFWHVLTCTRLDYRPVDPVFTQSSRRKNTCVCSAVGAKWVTWIWSSGFCVKIGEWNFSSVTKGLRSTFHEACIFERHRQSEG